MRALVTALAALLAAGCRPELGTPNWQVTAQRIVALRGVPAEARPGTTITWDALVVSPEGTIVDAPLDWSLCNTPKPAALAASVSPVCLSLDMVQYLVYARPSVSGAIPADACRLHGPDLPPRVGDEPQSRPRDPDETGGYYQPLRADLGPDFTIGLQRIRCAVAGASMDVALAYAARYTDNKHPRLAAVELTRAGAAVAADAVPAGALLTVTARFAEDAAETFPRFDLAAGNLVDRREALRVAWFASRGAFELERTGRAEADMAPSSDNSWTAPADPGPAHLWVVLRDSRGGVDWAALDVSVVAP